MPWFRSNSKWSKTSVCTRIRPFFSGSTWHIHHYIYLVICEARRSAYYDVRVLHVALHESPLFPSSYCPRATGSSEKACSGWFDFLHWSRRKWDLVRIIELTARQLICHVVMHFALNRFFTPHWLANRRYFSKSIYISWRHMYLYPFFLRSPRFCQMMIGSCSNPHILLHIVQFSRSWRHNRKFDGTHGGITLVISVILPSNCVQGEVNHRKINRRPKRHRAKVKLGPFHRNK